MATGRWLTVSALAMALGLALNSVLGPFLFDAIDYGFTETIRNQAIGLDAVSLIVVAPATVMAALAMHRGYAWGAPVLLAAAAYTAYVMVQYLVGPNYTVAPRVFPFQLALFIAAVLVGAGSWASPAAHIAPGGDRRALIVAMFAVAAFVVLRYLGPLLGSATEETLPNEYAENPAFFWTIALMDLGLFVPAAIATAIGLLQRQERAFGAAYAIVAWFVLVTIAVTAMSLAMYVNDDEFASGVGVAMFGVFSVAVLMFAGWAFRDLGELPPEGQG